MAKMKDKPVVPHRVVASLAEVSNIIGQLPREKRAAVSCDPQDDGTFNLVFDPALVPEVAALAADDPKPRLLAYLANKRWQVEVGGCAVDGAPMWTDRETQGKLQGLVVSLNTGAITAPVPLKGPNGFKSLSQEATLAAAGVVARHVQQAYAVEAQLAEAIAAGTVTSESEIDSAAWPANS